MRTIIIFLVVILAVSCKTKKVEPKQDTQQAEVQTNSITKANALSWLTGSWKRIDDKAGQQTMEHWDRKSDIEFVATAQTKEANKTIWQEYISMTVDQDKVTYSVHFGDMNQTHFDCKIETQGFVCTNLFNDYPKRIEYKLNQDTLRARISGGGPEERFTFIKPDILHDKAGH